MANIVAYHFSASLPRVPANSVQPPRSRLSAPCSGIGQAAERPGLLEFLRELAFEQGLGPSVDRRFRGPSFRIGLAATPWQLQQSLNLLQRQSLPNPLNQPGASDANLDRVVALVMNTSLNSPFASALGTLWLRRDCASGLPQDSVPSTQQALDHLREAGKRLVAVEALAFDEQAPLKLVLEPMMRALKSIVVDLWDATDIVASVPRSQVAYYCSKLGFSRVAEKEKDKSKNKENEQPHATLATTVLLYMPTQHMEQALLEDSGEALSA
jgi:hypothetical protein